MPTRLLLIAHGATTATRRATFPLDEPIEAPARVRAEALADGLPRGARAYVGPERRTRETAAALGLEATPQTPLADVDLGHWQGKSFDDLLAEEPEALAAWTSDPAWRGHGGEAVEDVLARVGPWLDQQRAAGGRVIAVTHPAVIRAAIVLVLGAPAASFWRIDIGPLAQVDLRADAHRWTLRELRAGE